MAKVPDELLIMEASLAAFTARMFEDSATGNDQRAEILRGIEQFLKSQPVPDGARLAEVTAGRAAAEAAGQRAHAIATAMTSVQLNMQPGDRIASVSVKGEGGIPAVRARVRLSGKGFIIEALTNPLGDAVFVIKHADSARTLSAEVLDSNAKVIATAANLITLNEDNLAQVEIDLTAPTPHSPQPYPPKA